MSTPIQSVTKGDLRRSIGRNIGAVVLGAATSTTDTSSLIDALNLARFTGDDAINGYRVIIYDAAGTIVDGEQSWVSDYAATTYDATCAPVFTASITAGDKYELWISPFIPADVDDAIKQAMQAVAGRCLQFKSNENCATEPDTYKYDWLTDFKGVYCVEYVSNEETYKVLHTCDTVWSELVDADVTVSVNTTIQREGTGCLKLVVAAGCGAGDKLATTTVTSCSLAAYDAVEIWFKSSVALNAGDLQLLLDDTALCASPLESINIPALVADKWTRVTIPLANPVSDEAIISMGLKMVVDKGAFTLYTDYIRAVDTKSRVWTELNPEQWSIIKGSTPYLYLTQNGQNVVGDNTIVRVSGYRLPTVLAADSDVTEIDPDYIIKEATGRLFMSQSSKLDIQDRLRVSTQWLSLAAARKTGIGTQIMGNVRWTN